MNILEEGLGTLEADYNQIKEDGFKLGLFLNSFPLVFSLCSKAATNLRHIKKKHSISVSITIDHPSDHIQSIIRALSGLW